MQGIPTEQAIHKAIQDLQNDTSTNWYSFNLPQNSKKLIKLPSNKSGTKPRYFYVDEDDYREQSNPPPQLGKIGQGGEANVYFAHEVEWNMAMTTVKLSDKPIVVKKFIAVIPNSSDDIRYKEMLRHTIKQQQHAIDTVGGVSLLQTTTASNGEKDTRCSYCLFMEYIPGGDLEWQAANIKNSDLYEVTHKALLFTKELKRQLIDNIKLHRDIKPDNVVGNKVRLIDWDYSVENKSDDAYSVIKNSEFVGSKEYSAPETQKDNSYSIKSELYSATSVQLVIFHVKNPIYDRLEFDKTNYGDPRKIAEINFNYDGFFDSITSTTVTDNELDQLKSLTHKFTLRCHEQQPTNRPNLDEWLAYYTALHNFAELRKEIKDCNNPITKQVENIYFATMVLLASGEWHESAAFDFSYFSWSDYPHFCQRIRNIMTDKDALSKTIKLLIQMKEHKDSHVFDTIMEWLNKNIISQQEATSKKTWWLATLCQQYGVSINQAHYNKMIDMFTDSEIENTANFLHIIDKKERDEMVSNMADNNPTILHQVVLHMVGPQEKPLRYQFGKLRYDDTIVKSSEALLINDLDPYKQLMQQQQASKSLFSKVISFFYNLITSSTSIEMKIKAVDLVTKALKDEDRTWEFYDNKNKDLRIALRRGELAKKTKSAVQLVRHNEFKAMVSAIKHLSSLESKEQKQKINEWQHNPTFNIERLFYFLNSHHEDLKTVVNKNKLSNLSQDLAKMLFDQSEANKELQQASCTPNYEGIRDFFDIEYFAR